MKWLIFILSIILFFACSQEIKQEENNVIIPSHLPIQSKKTFEYYYEFGKPQAQGKFDSECLYNELGCIINEKKGSYEYVHEYIKKNYKTFSYVLDPFSSDTLQTYKHFYNQDLLKNTIIYDHNGKTYGKIEYSYDEKNNLIEENYYKRSGDLEKGITYEYDKTNRLTFTHLKTYGEWGLSEPYHHHFDSTGLMTHSIWYDNIGEPFMLKKYEYIFYKN